MSKTTAMVLSVWCAYAMFIHLLPAILFVVGLGVVGHIIGYFCEQAMDRQRVAEAAKHQARLAQQCD